MRDIFERLSPPPDGLQGLQRKLDELDGENPRAGWFASAPLFLSRRVFAASLLALIVSSGLIFSTWRSGEDEQRMDYGIFQTVMEEPGQREEVVLPAELNPRLSLVPLESSNPKVKIYWIEENDG